MICSKCNKRELKEIVLFSSIEHACHICDVPPSGPIPFKKVDPIDLVQPTFKASEIKPWVPINLSFDNVTFISDGSTWRRVGDRIEFNWVLKLHSAIELVNVEVEIKTEEKKPGVYWGEICDMP